MSRSLCRPAPCLCVVAVTFAAFASLAAEAARADALLPPPTCPTAPHDGGSCAAFDVGTACRYPRRGIVCACERVNVDGHRARRWTCGELGE